MNRLVAAGIASAAQSGERVLVVTSATGRRPAFDEIARLLPESASRSRDAGRESIRLVNGGSVMFRTVEGCRGVSADTVYIDASVGQSGLLDLRERLRPNVASSPRGEVLRP